VPLVTLSEGEISELHVGLKGTMNALFSKTSPQDPSWPARADREGLFAGAVGYGYRMVRRLTSEGRACPARAGDRRGAGADRQPHLPRVRRRQEPRAIARDLNAEGIPGPSGCRGATQHSRQRPAWRRHPTTNSGRSLFHISTMRFRLGLRDFIDGIGDSALEKFEA